MPRKPGIWWYKTHKCFYTTINGKKERLDPDRKTAEEMFYKMKAQDEPKKPVDGESVAAVLDAFIDWCYENRAEKTASRYKDFCQEFVLDHGRMRVGDLTSRHVNDWLQTKPQWNSTTKHNAIGALIRGFNWGVKNYGLKANPIQGMEKPKPNKRTDIITPEEFEEVINHYEEEDPFRDLFTVSYDCGTRPREIKRMEARHLQLDKNRAVILSQEGKGEVQRAIYFTERAKKIVERLAEKYPEGLLFRNAKGTQWTDSSIRCRFQRLQKHIGKRHYLYKTRHTSITRRLANGVDSHIVAKLHGHSDTKMLDKVYSHIADDYEFMSKQANVGEGAEEDETQEPSVAPESRKKKRTPKRRSRKS